MYELYVYTPNDTMCALHVYNPVHFLVYKVQYVKLYI